MAAVPYTAASGILNGRLIQPANLDKIVNAIESAPVIDPSITREEFRQQMRETLSRHAGQKLTLTIIDQA